MNNNCTDSDVQEMLPDLLHGALAEGARARVEAHVATCESCQEDLDVLRTVKNAAVFAPSIDVDRVVRQIPPYRTIVPATERPVSTRMVSWLVAASLGIVVFGGGSLLMTNRSQTASSSSYGMSPSTIAKAPEVTKPSTVKPPAASQAVQQEIVAPHPHALALAADADGLSDGGLVQLMNDMDKFDALPAADPEPVIAVDSGDSL